MPIKDIVEIKNPVEMKMKPIKEKMDIFVPGIINENISRRNGMVYVLTGSGGSGKSSLLLNLMKDKSMYRGKFHNIFYICPSSSFSSVKNHPFEKHERVYHDLSVSLLEDIYQQLNAIKEKVTEKKKKKPILYEDQESDSDEEEEMQYSCIIFDDQADALKNTAINTQLNKMIIKARHISCSFIFTLQSYFYMPKILRKQITYITIFKCKNIEEWNTIAGELMNLNKDDALKIFNYVFNEPYAHIDIDLVSNVYYKNFNKLILNN